MLPHAGGLWTGNITMSSSLLIQCTLPCTDHVPYVKPRISTEPNVGLHSVPHKGMQECNECYTINQKWGCIYVSFRNSKRQWILCANFQDNTASSCTAPHPTPLPKPHSSDWIKDHDRFETKHFTRGRVLHAKRGIWICNAALQLERTPSAAIKSLAWTEPRPERRFLRLAALILPLRPWCSLTRAASLRPPPQDTPAPPNPTRAALPARSRIAGAN